MNKYQSDNVIVGISSWSNQACALRFTNCILLGTLVTRGVRVFAIKLIISAWALCISIVSEFAIVQTSFQAAI
jgi:hypothetical protein